MTVAAIVISLGGGSEAILVERCSCWVVDAITTISKPLSTVTVVKPAAVNLPANPAGSGGNGLKMPVPFGIVHRL
jgi:hypothetical protein